MNEQIDRYKGWRHELLAVEAQLAEHKRAYLVDRVHCPAGLRASLEAQRAGLRLQIHELRPEIVRLHEEAKKEQRQHMLHRLIDLCTAAGQGALVARARDDSRQAVAAMGMGGALRVEV